MLSGEATDENLYDFMTINPEIFEDAELYNKFLSGQNLTLDLINKKIRYTKKLPN